MKEPVVVAQAEVKSANTDVLENMSIIYRETLTEDAEFELVLLNLNNDFPNFNVINFIDPGMLYFGYRLLEGIEVNGAIGGACSEIDDGMIEKVITHSHHHHNGHGDHSHINHIFYGPYDTLPVDGYQGDISQDLAAQFSQFNQK